MIASGGITVGAVTQTQANNRWPRMPVGNFKRWTMKTMVVILAAAGSAFGQDVLSLSSGSVVAGQTISLDLSLTAPVSGGPAGIEWTYSYPATTFSSVAVVAGPAAAAAGK